MTSSSHLFTGGPWDGDLMAVDDRRLAYLTSKVWVREEVQLMGATIPMWSQKLVSAVYERDGDEFVCVVVGSPEQCTEALARLHGEHARGDG